MEVTFNPAFTSTSAEDKREQHVQNAALGIGTTGAVSYQAKQYAAKSSLKNMFGTVTQAGKTVSTNAKEAATLWGKYKQNVVRYTKFAIEWVSKFENSKYLKPFFKNKLVLGAASAFGTVMAFFALVTGVNKSIKNGKLMIGDLEDKFRQAA